jgi:hypothetical protein
MSPGYSGFMLLLLSVAACEIKPQGPEAPRVNSSELGEFRTAREDNVPAAPLDLPQYFPRPEDAVAASKALILDSVIGASLRLPPSTWRSWSFERFEDAETWQGEGDDVPYISGELRISDGLICVDLGREICRKVIDHPELGLMIEAMDSAYNVTSGQFVRIEDVKTEG